MPGDFKHLDLVLQTHGRKKPKKLGIYSQDVMNNQADRQGHSARLTRQIGDVKQQWSDIENVRQQEKLPALPADKPLLIKLPVDVLDIEFLQTAFDFEIVCEYDDGFVISATKPEKLELGLEKIKAFANNVDRTGTVAKINTFITEETNESRLKRILSENLYAEWEQISTSPSLNITVDLSLECHGTEVISSKPQKEEDEPEEHYQKRFDKWETKARQTFEKWDELCRQREQELEDFVHGYGGEVIDIIGPESTDLIQDWFDVKVIISHKGLVDLAYNYPYIFGIRTPDNFIMPTPSAGSGSLPSGLTIISPEKDSPIVCIIDSGIQEGHAYLRNAIIPGASKCYLGAGIDVFDHVIDGGHGTRVAGAVLYPNGVTAIKTPQYQLPCFIANARVLDDNNSLLNNILPAKLINQVIQDYLQSHNIRLFNHSISSSYPCSLQYMSSWAATIDNLSYEKDVLVIQAAGNIPTDNQTPFSLGIYQHISAGRLYPSYLLTRSARIANPAQSMEALTVGSINFTGYDDADWASLGGEGSVSTYSRTGFGLWDAIKPEVVEYGGDDVYNKTQVSSRPEQSMLPELIRVSPPAYAKDEAGTSFATPKVTHIASQLQRYFPDKSSLFYKSLIIQSAKWTDWSNIATDKRNVLRVMGYGFPDIDRALNNNPYRITYISSGNKQIAPGYVDVYRVKVPNSIRNLSNDIRIDVTLSFSAKPRRTRKGFRGYFSTWVSWETSYYNETLSSFEERTLLQVQEENGDFITNTSSNHQGQGIRWTIGSRKDSGRIMNIRRNDSANQKDWAVVKGYDLPLDFCIAVMGRKGWDNKNMFPAKYALCVSFEAVNSDVEVYSAFVNVDVEVPVEQGIEIETEDEAVF